MEKKEHQHKDQDSYFQEKRSQRTPVRIKIAEDDQGHKQEAGGLPKPLPQEDLEEFSGQTPLQTPSSIEEQIPKPSKTKSNNADEDG